MVGMKLTMYVYAGTVTFLACCNFGKEIQVERVNVQLVKIDTIYRESGDFKVFTWKSDDRLMYQSVEPIDAASPDVGTTIAMLIKR